MMRTYYTFDDDFDQLSTELRHLYFGYGMNTNIQGMASRCPGAVSLGPATLPNYRFTFRTHADVQLEADCWVDGVLWEINDVHLKSLDRLEGFPSYYLRHKAFVEHEGEQKVAWIYTMADQTYEAAPGESYLRCCIEGYESHGVPTDQIKDALRYVEAVEAELDQSYYSRESRTV
jgi:gamma-glutamylcyclotransferase (GGCT)/AIG2-like uncharacterized protein YtfP